MVVQSQISEAAYLDVALREPDGHWELYQGVPREKPGMSFTHNHLWLRLSMLLAEQLEADDYTVGANGGHLRVDADRYYIPDVFVAPAALTSPLRDRLDRLEVYDDPLPLVVEIRSPSTGSYDVGAKLAGYQQRGDLEIWRIHPADQTLIAWRRQADGIYTETVYEGGVAEPATLPHVAIDLATLFT